MLYLGTTALPTSAECLQHGPVGNLELIKLGMTLGDESTGMAVGIHRTVGVGET